MEWEQSNANPGPTFLDLPSAIISEIFNHLGPKELSRVSCVCTLFFKLSSDCESWKDFFCTRWEYPPFQSPQKTWKELYVERETRSRAFMGSYQTDSLHGHMVGGVRAVCTVPHLNLIFTGGCDRVVRIWNMEEALPIMSSRPLNFTIRAIEADVGMLVVGGCEAPIRCWRATEGIPYVFKVCDMGCEICLWGHTGPVTCLGLDGYRIYSGSWDMCIRVWDRESMECVKVLRHMDWVWALVPRGSKVLSASGSDVYGWDVESGKQLGVRSRVHLGQVYSLQCSQSGEFLFTGGEDGAIHMFDESSDAGKSITSSSSSSELPLASWVPHSGPIYSLAFEDPWLVSASADGRLAVMDAGKLIRSYSTTKLQSGKNGGQIPPSVNATPRNNLQCVVSPQRMLHGFHKNSYSVHIGAKRIICGGEEKFVKIWDFSQALEIERRVQASRTIPFDSQMRKKKGKSVISCRGNQVGSCTTGTYRIDADTVGAHISKGAVKKTMLKFRS